VSVTGTDAAEYLEDFGGARTTDDVADALGVSRPVALRALRQAHDGEIIEKIKKGRKTLWSFETVPLEVRETLDEAEKDREEKQAHVDRDEREKRGGTRRREPKSSECYALIHSYDFAIRDGYDAQEMIEKTLLGIHEHLRSAAIKKAKKHGGAAPEFVAAMDGALQSVPHQTASRRYERKWIVGERRLYAVRQHIKAKRKETTIPVEVIGLELGKDNAEIEFATLEGERVLIIRKPKKGGNDA